LKSKGKSDAALNNKNHGEESDTQNGLLAKEVLKTLNVCS
jgi:hypothetical protein